MADKSATLSRAEHRVFKEMLTGACDKEIAARLNISLQTVKQQLSKCYKKLGVNNGRRAFIGYEVTIKEKRFHNP